MDHPTWPAVPGNGWLMRRHEAKRRIYNNTCSKTGRMPIEVANLQHACRLCETQTQLLCVSDIYCGKFLVVQNITYAFTAPVGV